MISRQDKYMAEATCSRRTNKYNQKRGNTTVGSPHLQKRTTNKSGENPTRVSPITKLTRRNAFFQNHEEALKETSERACRNKRVANEQHDILVQSDLTNHAARISNLGTEWEQPYRPATCTYMPHGRGERKPQHQWNIRHPTR